MSPAQSCQQSDTAMMDLPAMPASGRPTWSGLLQLSLVAIPIKAYPAACPREVSHFHQLHAGCGQRIRYHKHCPVHGAVDATNIVRGYEYVRGQHVIVEPSELDRLRPARDRALRLERFVTPDQIDPVQLTGRSLYLLPDGLAAQHAYHVLHQVLVQRGRWALGRAVLSSQRQLVLVRPTAAALALHVLHYLDEMRACPARTRPAKGAPVTAEELQLAGMLIDAASRTPDWGSYRDERGEELRALIEAKIADRQTEPEPPSAVLPLMDALKQSVAAAMAPQADVPPQLAKTVRKRGRKTA